MDLFSHALLPYLLGNFFKRKKEEITALVLGGIAPDFDVLILWINSVYPNFFLISHRGITHSFFFGFFTGIAVLYLASAKNVKNKVRRYIDFEPLFSARTAAFAFAGVIIHLFLDAVTTRGVPLFYPFETTRYSAEVFFFTDTVLMITSFVIVLFLLKKPLQKNTIPKLFLVFLLVFAGMGMLRIDQKYDAGQIFQNAKAYPTMDPFDWYVVEENRNEISIFEYSGFEKRALYNETVPRVSILSKGDGLDAALYVADELPQVKMFRWRAYAVAVNASLSSGTWYLEYYDPLRRAQLRDSRIFRKIAPGLISIKVTVEGKKASVT